MAGKLYLIPNTLGECPIDSVIPTKVIALVNMLSEFIVEDAKAARKFLKLCGYEKPLDALVLHILNEHTPVNEMKGYLGYAEKGGSIGLLSDAGCPGIADPGAEIVKMAHRKSIQVIPLTGPSSIPLALMASGFNGQNFCFHGYLPKEKNERVRKLREIEKDVLRKDQTQLFIETPYRNNQLLADIVSVCSGENLLCIACDISLDTEFIRTQRVEEWRKKLPDIDKRPAIFLIYK